MATSRRARTYTFAIVGSILFLLYRWTHHQASTRPSSTVSSSPGPGSAHDPLNQDQDDDSLPVDWLSPPGSGPFYRPNARPSPPEDTYLTEFTPSVMAPSSVMGFTVVDYLYLLDGKMYFARGAGHQRMDQAEIVTGGDDWVEKGSDGESEAWWHEVKGRGVGGQAADDTKVRVLGGTTIMFHDEGGPSGYLPMAENFGPEAFVSALKAVSLVPDSPRRPASLALLPPPHHGKRFLDPDAAFPARVMFPRASGEQGGKGWKDTTGKNEWLLSVALPGVPIEELSDWQRRAASGELVAFERVVIVDRWAAHRHPDTVKWKKMNSFIATQSSLVRDWFQPYRASALQALGIKESYAPRKKPVVVYLDRNRNNQAPRLTLDSHLALIKALKKIAGRAEVHQTVLMNMRKEEIVKLMSTATIVISGHTSELFHTMWMPATKYSTVFELMDSKSFVRENQLVSQMLNHDHLVVHEDRIVPQPEWEKMDVDRSDRWEAELNVSPEVMMDRVIQILDAYDKQPALRHGNP